MTDLKNIVRKNIWNLAPYSSARDEFKGTADVFLDANENPYGELNRYPDPQQKAIKQRLSKLKNVKTDQIFVGNGSDEVIDLAFRIFCEPGKDIALTFTPTYGMYEVSANINDVDLIKLPLVDDFQINTSQLQTYFSDENLKLIFICSPNNPTGNNINIQNIEFILNNFNGIVIVDEAYIDFSSQASFINKINTYNNLIVCQTFSKAWGLAAVRVGIAYANSQIIQLFNKVKHPYNVGTINQNAVLNALDNQVEVKQRINQLIAERKRLRERLTSIKKVNKVYPSEANFLLVDIDNATEVYEYLIQQKIIIRNRTTQVKNCIRITVGTPEENEKLINTLQNLT
ncbi:histidinol-phosphate transaminase [Tenacibaculum sp. IB213877]|uniref:histidinol-phosphate transaminase n=1 Tax=Tenacibaculum sp. IB213877 TaxID=3097351 RepID=UPI002A5A09FF|nr:histidinol-phosphate transaminase [Tenacibaculum sp. IB213877]MDY0779559.1 histidinol-phosphate transaminase [Tenacibaculum sp. IB213877]